MTRYGFVELDDNCRPFECIQLWRRHMEMFSHYWPFVMGIHQSLVESNHKDQ